VNVKGIAPFKSPFYWLTARLLFEIANISVSQVRMPRTDGLKRIEKVSVSQVRGSLNALRRNRPKGESAFPLLDFPSLFQHALRSLAMFQVSLRKAGNLAALRFLLSVFEPLVSKPLRSARFLKRPQDSKFKSRMVLSFRNVDWRAQKWHRMNGSRPMARSLKFGNRVAMTFCATH